MKIIEEKETKREAWTPRCWSWAVLLLQGIKTTQDNGHCAALASAAAFFPTLWQGVGKRVCSPDHERQGVCSGERVGGSQGRVFRVARPARPSIKAKVTSIFEGRRRAPTCGRGPVIIILIVGRSHGCIRNAPIIAHRRYGPRHRLGEEDGQGPTSNLLANF